MTSDLALPILAECLPWFEAAGARPVGAGQTVWNLKLRGWPWSKTHRAFCAAQYGVLRAFLARAPACFLVMDSPDVLDWAVTRTWHAPFPDTFQIPQGVEPEQLVGEVLYPGGWCLYCSPAAVDPARLHFDSLRLAPELLVDSLAALHVEAYISAFWDNDPWKVAFTQMVESNRRTDAVDV